MPEPSQVEGVVAWFITRLQTISIANGFFTDLGATLLVNEEPPFGEDDPKQVLVLLVGDDEQTAQGKAILLRLPITVAILVDATEPDKWKVLERGIADVKRALELDDDRRMGGLSSGPYERGNVERVPRESGSLAMGAGVPYFIPLKEGWGNP